MSSPPFRRLRCRHRQVVALAALSVALCSGGVVAASDVSSASDVLSPLAIPTQQEPPADRIFLVSTRRAGTRCDGEVLRERLSCERLIRDANGCQRWADISFAELAGDFADALPTVIYVHGNRIEGGEDKPHGMAVYRSLSARASSAGPMRFIIWSWPADQIPGRVRDYHVKAARTGPVGWQLAWTLDQLPDEAPLALIGYSYGARVVTGALHVLAGGSLGHLQLDERRQPTHSPVRVALVAAAVHADWLRPSGYHGRALEQVEELVLVNNQLDPAMRFYRLAMEGRDARALGYAGVGGLGQFADKVRTVDATQVVGRHHGIGEYLASVPRMNRVWATVIPAAEVPTAPTLESQFEALSDAAVVQESDSPPQGEIPSSRLAPQDDRLSRSVKPSIN
jgi:hypothetical protein